jgi:hypothetical protein
VNDCLAAAFVLLLIWLSLLCHWFQAFSSTVCPQSSLGVLKNCGAQTN